MSENNEEEKQYTNEELVAMINERKVLLAEKYVEPHTKKPRRVKEEDVVRLVEDAKIMHEMCLVGRGDYTSSFATAHTQINNEDPLRFFVTMDGTIGQIYINPVITGHGHEIYQTPEGCMSFPSEPMKDVSRFQSITVKYRTLAQKTDPQTGDAIGDPYLTNEVTTTMNGKQAQIMQHMCQILNGSYIYDKDASMMKALNEPVDKE